jgi:hypothetical protein
VPETEPSADALAPSSHGPEVRSINRFGVKSDQIWQQIYDHVEQGAETYTYAALQLPLVWDPVLAPYQVAWHAGLRQWICIPCGVCIPVDAVVTHVKGHQDGNTGTEDTNDIREVIGSKAYASAERHEMLSLPAVCPPITGLRIHHDGLACGHPGCQYACLASTSIRQHQSNQHKTEKSLPYFKNIPVSRLFNNGLRQSYFRVKPDLGVAGANESIALYHKTFFPAPDVARVQQDSLMWKESREIPPWLRRLGWRELLESHDREALKRLINPADRALAGLSAGIDLWMSQASGMVSAVAADIRQRLASEDEYVVGCHFRVKSDQICPANLPICPSRNTRSGLQKGLTRALAALSSSI